jgi:pimeloyl-ACP methyl ester carboxylesterase
MGGAVAQHVALQAPERVASLVLLHTWGRTDAFLRAVFESWRLLVERLSPEEFLAMQAPWVFNARFLAAPPPQVVAMQRDDLARGWPRSTAALQRQLDACIAHDVLQALVILQTPTLVLVGEDDILTPPRYGRALAAMLGRADLAVVPGAAHGGPFEAPKAVAERALEFLARRAGA